VICFVVAGGLVCRRILDVLLGDVAVPPASLAVGRVIVGTFSFIDVVAFDGAGLAVEGRCSLRLPVVVAAAAAVGSRWSSACLFGVQLFALAFAGALSIVGGGRGFGACLLPIAALLSIGV